MCPTFIECSFSFQLLLSNIDISLFELTHSLHCHQNENGMLSFFFLLLFVSFLPSLFLAIFVTFLFLSSLLLFFHLFFITRFFHFFLFLSFSFFFSFFISRKILKIIEIPTSCLLFLFLNSVRKLV